jgi:chaperonin GroES
MDDSIPCVNTETKKEEAKMRKEVGVLGAVAFHAKYSKAFDIKNLHPKDDIVIAKVIDEETISKGGIVIPQTAEKPVMGIVIAVGPGKPITKGEKAGERIPMEIRVGDKILFSKWANLDMTIRGEDLKIVREDSIVGILED